ncbi:MAG: HEAT repeat domain-containing protein [Candidatus Hydrogenedentes bacterium]|nr:HEAT repeat domain-containing protein [Candidatus Hydrogenedentota bacterium]
MSIRGRFTWSLLFLGSCAGALAQTQDVSASTPEVTAAYAWSDEKIYRPPDFDAYFPDSEKGAHALSVWWMETAAEKEAADAEEVLGLVRQGLRRYEGNRMPLLRWLGNAFIWGKDPQHAGAIEIMYHASECSAPNADVHGTRGAAVYFGLSVVRPKTDAILRTLVDLCVLVDDPNDLSRVAWGVGTQRDAALRFLEPHLRSKDTTTREKAEVVRQILSRKLKAFVWAEERKRVAAQAAYGDKLDELAQTLWSGSSTERRTTLDLIAREGVTLIMSDVHVEDFARCATDPDPAIRRRVARMVGSRWIWSARKQNPEAIALLLLLSEDVDRDVRYNAVYFGLSTVKEKETDVLRRLLEMAFADREPNLYRRIAWGLRGDRERVRELLDAYIDGGTPTMATAAREVYGNMTED